MTNAALIETRECPEPEAFAALLRGELDDPQADPLERHLLDCPRCAARAPTLAADDRLVEALRHYRPREPREEGRVDQIIERFCESRASGDSGSASDSAAGPAASESQSDAAPRPLFERLAKIVQPAARPETPQSRAGEQADEEELYDFLAPPEVEGELGRLGGYRVLQVIGTGGMGVVFLAEDPQLSRRVALKAMHPALAASESARRRFLQEARAAAAIEHDHIVSVYQVGTDRGIPFLAMPLLRGQTLEERLESRARLPLAEAVRIARELAQGLAAAHGRGLIHRDVKPANIWLEEGSGRVKILDFGLARAADSDDRLTRAGTIVGTPGFLSPEQARGEPADARSDLFSLGCTLYLMCTGEPPFVGAGKRALRDAVLDDEPPPAESLRSDLPAELAKLLARLLEKEPARRPADTEEVSAELARIERVLTEPKSAAPADRAARPAASPIGLWPTIALGLLGLALAGGLAWRFGGGLYRIATNQGLLTIETSDPQITVTIKRDGQEVEVSDAATGRTLTLSAGPYQLELAGGKEGLRLESDRITLLRGDEKVVRVRFEPQPLAQKPPPAAAPAAPVAAPRASGGLPPPAWSVLAFWFMPDQLLTHDEIVRDLKLTDGQWESIRQAWAEYQQTVAAIPRRTRENSAEVSRRQLTAVAQRVAAIREALGERAQRLDQIAAQSAGLATLFYDRPNRRAPQLGITPAQLAQGREILAAVYEEMAPGDISARSRTAFVDITTPKLLALLSDEQKQRWQDAMGEPVPAAVLSTIRGGVKSVPIATPATAPDAAAGPPDLTGIKPLVDNAFTDAATSKVGREIRGAAFDSFFDGGRHVLVYKQDKPHALATFPVLDVTRDFACQVVARAKGKDADGWGLYIVDAERRGIGLKLARDGTLRFEGSFKNVGDFPGEKPALARHETIRRGDDDNTLLVVFRDHRLAVFVNSMAVVPPVKIEERFKPERILLAARPEWKDSRAEFKQVTVWPVGDAP